MVDVVVVVVLVVYEKVGVLSPVQKSGLFGIVNGLEMQSQSHDYQQKKGQDHNDAERVGDGQLAEGYRGLYCSLVEVEHDEGPFGGLPVHA